MFGADFAPTELRFFLGFETTKMSPRRGWDCQRSGIGVCQGHELSGLQSASREKGASGIWLDEGEFSRIYQEMKGSKTAPPGCAAAIAQAAAHVRK